LTETPENNEPTPEEESEGVAADESAGATEGAAADQSAGATAPTGESDEPSGPAPSSDASPEAQGEEVVSEDPIVEQPAQAAAEAAAEPEPAEGAAAATDAAEPEPAEGAVAATEPEAVTGEQAEPADEVEVTPRQKPEIPGADLEPDLIPDAELYLDAEAQAAAEAEAEAAAERARAEAEDEQAKPIADAAIDLAAGARYTATGKRKTAVARVILKPGTGEYSINGKPLETFFPRQTLQRMIRQPLETVGYEARMDVVARMHGGGVSAQAGALRHGISRALIDADPNLRGELKRRGYLTRDPRVKERKKAGLKKARKRPQFSKR
jgi:small subunit ribosomal protein S9